MCTLSLARRVAGLVATGWTIAALLAWTAAPAAAAGSYYLVASEFAPGTVRITDLVVDASGGAFVSGVILGYDTAGVDAATYTNAGSGQRFVARYAPLAVAPTYVAVVGLPAPLASAGALDGFLGDEAVGLALDRGGNAFLVAYEGDAHYPATGGAFVESTGRKHVYRVAADGSVTRVSAALDPAIRRIGALAVDAGGAILLTGSAADGLATTAGAPYPSASTASGCTGAFAMKLDATAQTVVYATYLGVSGTGGHPCGGHVARQPSNLDPTGFAIAVDAVGNAYVGGQAEPGLAATPGALDLGTKAVGAYVRNNLVTDPASHAFVVKLSPAGSIVYAARLGGSLRDRATSLVVDGTGSVVIAGKTSSPDFPRTPNTALSDFPSVTMDCLLWTPEAGFLARLTPDASQLAFSGYLPLAGDQLDDCSGFGGFHPARVAQDGAGTLYAVGMTDPGNRAFRSTFGAIIPDGSHYGGQLLQIFSADGRQRLYSTALDPFGAQGIGLDSSGNVLIAGDRVVQRLANAMLPVELVLPASAVCATQPFPLRATVATTADGGTVEFASDGAVVATAALVAGVATASATVSAVGIRKMRATYRGSGAFAGYTSLELDLAVNQPGTCP